MHLCVVNEVETKKKILSTACYKHYIDATCFARPTHNYDTQQKTHIKVTTIILRT